MKYKAKKFKKKLNKYRNKILKIKKNVILFWREDGKLQKIKVLLNKFIIFLNSKNIIKILMFSLPFIIMDAVLRNMHKEIEFFPYWSFTPRLFTLAYIILIVGLVFLLKRKHAYLFYTIIAFLLYLMFFTNGIYYATTDNFFNASLLGLASEGSSYFLDALKNGSTVFYIFAIIVLVLLIYNYRLFPNNKNVKKKKIYVLIVLFLAMHFVARVNLGPENFELTWDSWRNPRNVYNNFNDSNKCMALSGFYEYIFRDFYVNYIKPTAKKSETENNFLEEVFSEKNDSTSKNSYTGIFKDKNVIFLQMEGIDNWLLTKEIMPNTYSLLNNAINFANHYSFYNGGGSTFNSEFAVNVGYMTPFTYIQNAYSLNRNDFPYSMANIMKNNDYYIRAFHMNSGEYYSRNINYQNWGYDRYFSLKDLGDYTDTSYYLDRELILNETFYNELFNNEGKFIDYIITYSTHMPFSTRNSSVCRKLINLDYEDKFKDMTASEQQEFIDSLNIDEEYCIKRQAKETDYFVGLLIQALRDNDLYNNTVIVAYADHYLYSVSDQTILDKYKDTSSNLINKTPFFIWSSGLKKANITKVTSQLNILPTFLNLMGVDYNEKWYLSKDALSNNYQPVTIFSDLSWYDGNIYVVDGIVKNDKKISKNNLEDKNNYVEYLIKKNDLVLKYNYFKEIAN